MAAAFASGDGFSHGRLPLLTKFAFRFVRVLLYTLLRLLRSSKEGSGTGAYGFHEGLENVENPGSTVLIVEIELKLLAKEEMFK
jgi:hypothetical protein